MVFGASDTTGENSIVIWHENGVVPFGWSCTLEQKSRPETIWNPGSLNVTAGPTMVIGYGELLVSLMV